MVFYQFVKVNIERDSFVSSHMSWIPKHIVACFSSIELKNNALVIYLSPLIEFSFMFRFLSLTLAINKIILYCWIICKNFSKPLHFSNFKIKSIFFAGNGSFINSKKTKKSNCLIWYAASRSTFILFIPTVTDFWLIESEQLFFFYYYYC